MSHFVSCCRCDFHVTVMSASKKIERPTRPVVNRSCQSARKLCIGEKQALFCGEHELVTQKRRCELQDEVVLSSDASMSSSV